MIRKLVFNLKSKNYNGLSVLNRFYSQQQSTVDSVKEQNSNETHFGFETVSVDKKQEKVDQVFEKVASGYDLMNDAMSAGVHRLWKDYFVGQLSPFPGTKLLDMAGGTGDIAFRYLQYIKNQTNYDEKQSYVTISDINQSMLDVGKKRAEKLGILNLKNLNVEFVCANAEKLPFNDNTYNAYTIAFGIRNVTYINKVLTEAYRVLEPGGRFMCLEFSHLPNKTLQWIYDRYSFEVIPPMSEILIGQWQPYQYLVESIRKFPDQEKFKEMIEHAGFEGVTYENLTFGVCAIHSGFKL